MSQNENDFMRGMVLISAGFLILFLGFILLFLDTLPTREATGGGIIIIGPLPIIITSEGQSLISILVVLTLCMALLIIFSLLFMKRIFSGEK